MLPTKVHSSLGPGLLESVYEMCLARELKKRRALFRRQVEIPVVYDGIRLEAGLRIDLLVDRKLIVEVKVVEEMNRIYKAQLLTYLKLTGLRLGLLINFNVALIKMALNGSFCRSWIVPQGEVRSTTPNPRLMSCPLCVFVFCG